MINEKDIDKEKYYSAKAVVDMQILPWKSRATFSKLLRIEKWSKIFNPIANTVGKRRRFYIKGEFIINYLKLADTKGELNK